MKRFLWLVFSPLAFLAIVALTVHHLRPEGPFSKRAQKTTQVAWSALEYLPVREGGEVLAKLDQLPICILDDKKLSEEQERKLRSSVHSMLRAYTQLDFNAFLQFRLPAPGHQALVDELRWRLHVIGRGGTNDLTDEYISRNAVELLQQVWEKSASIGPWWTGINLDFAQLEVLTTNRVGNLAHDLNPRRVPPNTRWATSQIRSSFYYFDHSPEAIQSKHQEVTFALFAVWAQPPKGYDYPRPFYCRFYWDPDETQWIPWRLAEGLFANINRSPIF